MKDLEPTIRRKKQEMRYQNLVTGITMLTQFLGLIAWAILLFINWKLAILLFFIIWGNNMTVKEKK